MVGLIGWLAQNTRPDLDFTLLPFCQMQQNLLAATGMQPSMCYIISTLLLTMVFDLVPPTQLSFIRICTSLIPLIQKPTQMLILQNPIITIGLQPTTKPVGVSTWECSKRGKSTSLVLIQKYEWSSCILICWSYHLENRAPG